MEEELEFSYQSFDNNDVKQQNREAHNPNQTCKKWAFVSTVAFLGSIVLFASQQATKRNTATLLHGNNGHMTSSSTKPNFIFMVVDDMGWNSIGYENFDLEYVTPMLNKLSSKGIRMTNYYAQEVCTPSRASLLTGRYPVSIGMQFEEVGNAAPWGLPLEETTLADVLKEEGYATYMLGKWHLGHYSPRYLPTARGFDFYLGYLTGETYHWSKKNTNYNRFHDLLYSNEDCYAGYNGTDMHTYSTFFYRDKAVNIVEDHDFTTPLFLYVAFQAVHDPFYDQYHFSSGIPKSYLSDSMYDTIMDDVVGRKRRQYAMSLNLVDEAVSDIYDAMVTAGQEENTYIVFTSDNGGCWEEGGKSGPLRGGKGTLWEGGVKVDAFIYSPQIPPSVVGTSYDGIMHVSDWFPTILDLADITYTAPTDYALDGVSQKKGWFKGSSQNERSYVLYNLYYNVDGKDFDIYTNAPLAIRNSQYKLIHAYTDTETAEWYSYDEKMDDDSNLKSTYTCDQIDAMESGGNYTMMLFNLDDDPYETTNLYDSTDTDDVDALTELNAQIDVWMKAAATCWGIQAASKAVESVWQTNGGYITPWIKESNLGDETQYPSHCSFTRNPVCP